MSLSTTRTYSTPRSLIRNFTEITKMRLSVSVVFSSIAGYLLAVEAVDFYTLFLLCVGGYCMVGASNVYNQIIERDLDALMDRTKDRPIPAGRMGVTPAFVLASLLTLAGIAVLYV
ncbi:MAG: protoheme IX farnesyltransferase, partial [Flavobacterium sp.]